MINPIASSRLERNPIGTASPSSPSYLSTAGGLLSLIDFFILLVGSLLTQILFSQWASGTVSFDAAPLIGIALVVVPVVLYDRRFVTRVAHDKHGRLWMDFALRWTLTQLVIVMLAFSGDWLDTVSIEWLTTWEIVNLFLMGVSRFVVFTWMKRRISYARQAEEATPAIDEAFDRKPLSGALVVRYVCDWLPVAMLAERPIRRWSAVAKAAKDYALCTLITLILLPLLAAIAIAIRLDSPGPILFRQRRHGLNNTDFDIYKFRTMRHTTVAPGAAMNQTLRDDVRVTRVGHWLRRISFDELPQVFNVLNGQMSLVGPRPHAVDMRTEQRLGQEIVSSYSHRHRVKPGITGLSQISGLRGATDTEDQLRRRVEMDIHYIDHWSLLLDIKILILTVKTVLRGTNAF
jgi:lipopolysaccharide/colanic/teichoic acid biosynthesis glycosyltransferase